MKKYAGMVFVFLAAIRAFCGLSEVYLILPDIPKHYESHWRDAYALYLSQDCGNVKTEVALRGGRADIVSSLEAIEIDKAAKWHEAIGQSLHYANELDKKPVIALYDYHKLTEPRKAALEDLAEKLGIEIVVLKRLDIENLRAFSD